MQNQKNNPNNSESSSIASKNIPQQKEKEKTKENDKIQADKAIELMRYNKINAKNAFDINVDFIESLSNILNKNEESAWQRASASLDVSAKVYGYRVDSVHSETYKFLGGLNRNKKEENKENNEEEINDEEKKKEVKIKRGQNTLETNLNKLNLTKYDLETEVDPLFSIMTSKFNESTASGLLLNTIPLDEKMNYILESKKVEDNKMNLSIQNIFKNIDNINNKEDNNNNNNKDEIKSINSESEQNININKENNQLLQSEEENKENNNKNKPIICSSEISSLPNDIKNILQDFKTQNPIDIFLKEKICPDLTIFRQSRELNENENSNIFLKHFKEEIYHPERIKINEYVDAQGIPENEDENIDESDYMDNMPEGYDNEENNNNENNNNSENNNNINDVIDPNDIKDIEDSSQNDGIINYNKNDNNTSMLMFKYDDLIEHSEKFGNGNIDFLRNLPQFNQFQKNFGKMEKNYLKKNTILGLGKFGQGHRKKKEEKLFEFTEDNEININDLLTGKTALENKNKNKSKKGYDFSNDFENKKKVKCLYNYDKLATFRLYTINNKTIYLKELDNYINPQEEEQKIINKMEEDNYDNNNDYGNEDLNGFDNGSNNNNQNNNNTNTFYQSEKEIEKNFGRLYRRFDIRSLKNKIWNNYENQFPRDNIDFRNIISNMSKDMTEEELYSISTPTCFVCMLHLCNENNLFVNQKDINTFYVEKDNNGEKSSKTLLSHKKFEDDITKPKNKNNKKRKPRQKKKKESESESGDSDNEMEINDN